jgi:predicted nucleotidyltransferase
MKTNILDRIKSFNLPQKQCVVVGSAILEIKGIRQANDLDILVTKEIFENFKKDNSWQVIEHQKRTGEIWEFLEKDGVQVYLYFYDNHSNYDINYFLAENSRVEVVEGVYFTSLTDLIRSKSLWSREKDLKDVERIKDYLLL